MVGNCFVFFGSNVRKVSIQSSFECIFCFTHILNATTAADDKVDEVGGIAVNVLKNLKSLARNTTMEGWGTENIVTCLTRFVARITCMRLWRPVGGWWFKASRDKEVTEVFGATECEHRGIGNGLLKFRRKMQCLKVLMNNIAEFGEMRIICGDKRYSVTLVFGLISEGLLTGNRSCFVDLRIYYSVIILTTLEVFGEFIGPTFKTSI